MGGWAEFNALCETAQKNIQKASLWINSYTLGRKPHDDDELTPAAARPRRARPP